MEKIVINNEFFLHKSTSDKCVIVVHGMVETMDGYEKLKNFLVDNGISVVLYNNRGHGKGASKIGHLETYESYKMSNDIVEIEKYVKDVYDYKEVIILGHSMGTALVRSAMKSTKFDKVILNGAPESISSLVSNFALLVYQFISDDRESKLFNKVIFSSYNKTVKDATSSNDWICSNKEYVNFYDNDPYSGVIGTGSFYQEIIRVMAMAKEVDIKPTRVLITSGSDDPTTKMGKSCYVLEKKLSKQGCNCNVILYDKMRHFIYDEIGCSVCYDDVLKFINEE